MKLAHGLVGLIMTALAPFGAAAQGLILFPESNYGKVNKSFEESAFNEAQLEVLMGKTALFEPVAELSATNTYRRLGRSVAMLDLVVEDENRVRHNTVCTATRIARDLLMTNYHCVPGRTFRTVGVQARFGFLDPQTSPGRLFGVELKPVESSAALDYAILKLTAIPSETDFPPVPLKRHVATDGESLILIHHPMGQAQRLTRFRCLAGSPAFSEGHLVHHCDTLGGSSGSAVFTQDGFAFAGLHFGGLASADRPQNLAKPAEDLFKASATLRGLETRVVTAATVTPPAPNAADRLAEAAKRYDAGWAAEQKSDFLTARLDYQAACDGGEPRACTNLGWLYEKGQGVTQDYATARRLYQQGCDGGNATGCTNLGVLYRDGFGVTQDYAAARRLYQQGCDGGDANGCTNLGWLYEKGQGVTQDYATARRLYQQGCDGGNATGCTNLGIFMHGGFGGTKTEAEGIRLVRKGCAGGNQGGCDWLANRNISRN